MEANSNEIVTRRNDVVIVGNKAAAMGERIGGCLRRWRGLGVVVFGLVAVLPGERGTEEGKGLPGASWRLKQGMAVAFPVSSVEGGDHSPHECKLRAVWLVRKLHLQASDVVHIFRVLAARVCCRAHFSLYFHFT